MSVHRVSWRTGVVLCFLIVFGVAGWRPAAEPALSRLTPEQLAGSILEAPDDPGIEKTRIATAEPSVRRIDAAGTAGPGAFQLMLETPPEAMSRAFLVYELAGVPHWTAAVRSINGLGARGGFAASRSSGVGLQIEEINPRWLRPGANQIVFHPAPAAEALPWRVSNAAITAQQPVGTIAYTVRNLRLLYLDGPAPRTPNLWLTHPRNGENDAAGAHLRGFVDPPGMAGRPAELFVDETYVAQGIDPADGAFSLFVPRTSKESEPWEVRIEVVYPDGSRLRRTVQLTGDAEKKPGGPDDDTEVDFDPGVDKSIGVGKARLDVPRGALARKVRLTMRALQHEELPALDAGMTNVTPRRQGFRLGPHGLRFREPVRLQLPYDPALIPNGMTAADIRTFFFDEEAGRWIPLPRVERSRDEGAEEAKAADVIVSATDHFTDFINATLALPEEPAGANFAPNSLQELAKADPASGIVEIAPPEGGASGDAALEYPLVVPPGRHGMEPQLAVHYQSGGGNGWLGVGWDLRLPSVEISTSFGVPRYDGTERYLLDGDQLAATTTAGVFVRRIEGSFDRIVRHGSGPADFWWEVTDKDGTRSEYGRTVQARLRDPSSGNTFRWYLERQIDLHGNTVDYSYRTDEGGGGADGERWTEVYPARIDYTGLQGAGAFYRVTFTLDDGGRPDRISSGRQGFKTYMRHRLARVDVLAGSDIVRRYVFHYREGDFRKTLLSAIAVRGEGAAAEFYRHTFDYVPMGTQSDGYEGFGAPQTWNGMGRGKDLTDSFRIGGGAHGFVGLGPPSCYPNAGVQLGGSGSDSTQRVSFLDVNGDGLSDRLDESGNVDLNQYDAAGDPDGSRPGRFGSAHFDNADALGHTSEWSLDFAVRVSAGPANADANWVWSNASDDRIVTDINGDLRPDLVSTGGGFAVRVNDGRSFASRSDWSGFAGSGLNLASPGQESEILSKFRLSHALRQLVLPYAGRVTLAGAIQKKEATGDGVDVAIYHNGSLVWSRRFAAGDTAPCTPGAGNSCSGGLSRDVRAGDTLYFLAGSVRETSADALLWTPSASYDGRDAEAREPYGARTFVFDAGEDFRLAGYRGASWRASAAGTIQISGPILKQETSDDVVVTVARNRAGTEETLFTRTFAAAEQTTFDALPSLAVAAGDQLFLRMSSRTPVDSSRVQWTPSVTYQGGTDPTLPEDLRSQHAQVAIEVPRLFPASEPTRSWTPSATGEQTFRVACNGAAAVTLYVQGVNRLLQTRAFPAKAETFELRLPVTAGETLFFTLLASEAFPTGGCSIDGGAIPLNVRWPSEDETPSVLSGGHHGWFYGDWNGNVPFNPAALVQPDSAEDEPDFMAGAPRWEGTKGFSRPVWTASGFDLYLAAEGVKPSRQGANAAAFLDSGSGSGGGGGLSMLRKTSSRTEGVSASLVAGLSLSHGESETQLDLLDMNGDRYPDQVSAGGVRFSNGRNGFGSLQGFPGLGSSVRRSEDGNVSLSVGLGTIFNKKNGKGRAKAVLSTLPTVGSTVSLTHSRQDLIDVNGDGLPDRVSIDPGSGAATVQLNLGYRFGAPEAWSLPALSSSGYCRDVVDYASSTLGSLSSLDTLNGISFTRSSALNAGVAVGPFGGGVSTTLSRTLVELADVNGDGLPDRVSKDERDPFFRVQLNLGDGWDREQRWYVPRWPTSIGDGYNPGGIFQCLDAVTFSGHVEVNGSVGVPLCIPLVPPIPILGLQIEISAQASGSTSSGMQLFLDDVDGDGLADHVLKKAGDSSVYVKRNQAGRVNLLRTVRRPLGSTIELSYERRGNHPDMPFSHWVLSKVSVADGRGSAPSVTRYQYGNDAFYDRAERESYGYADLRITQPDGSTIARDYLNRDFYSRHRMTKEVLADAAGNLFRVETARYEQQPVAGSTASRFPALVAESTAFYEGTTSVESSAPKTTGKLYDYDTLGNVVRITDLADSGAGDDVTTTIAYRFDPDTRVTRPATMEVRDATGRLLRGRQGTYDDHGDLERLEYTLIGGRDPESGSTYSGSKNAVWTYTWDEVGNLASSTDPSGYTSTFTYDTATRTHAVEVRDSFGYVTRYAHDLKYGELTATTDENGNTIRRAYDAFGRLIRVVGPDDTDAAPTLSFEYGPGAPVSWSVVRHKDAARSDTIDSSVFIDSLGRTLQTKEDAELDLGSGTSTRTGMRVSGRIVFDEKGRVVSEGQPLFDDRPAHQFVDVPSKNPTTFTYDALDRPRTVRFAHGGVTRIDYVFGTLDGARRLLTVRTDPHGRATRFYRDVEDNVIGVEQTNTIAGARKTLVTRYSYDGLDQLTAVTDAKGNTTRLEYDTLGRRVVLANPDLGRVESRYDPAGNLGARITPNLAARGQQIRYFYTFGRLDRIDYPQSPDVVYTYGGPGAPFHRANRIVTVTDASGVEERSYGKLGEIVQTVKTTAALNGNTPKGPYTTRLRFDSFNRLLSVVYPDGETLTYGYDAGGNVKSATGVLKGVRFEYLRHLGYDEFGERARMLLGNGVETRYTHDPASRFLTQLRTTAGGRDVQNLRYRYDLTGTMQGLQNDAGGAPASQTFQYDDLVQLVSAQGTYGTGNKTSAYSLAFSYDELGNTISKNQLHQSGNGAKLNVEKKTSYNAAYSYSGPQPHAATRVGERTFVYDLNGNQTGWTTDSGGTRRTLTWDDENRLAAVADNGQTTRFLYDADGTRTNKAGQHGETIYVNRWFTLRNGTVASKHVFADDVRLATKVSPDPDPLSEKAYFFQADHLGSTQFVTDESGTVYQHLEYFPSGEIWIDERSETQRTPYLFSAKELDEETALSYFGHRYYDARQGQWISADPILDEMLDVEKLTASKAELSPFFLSGHVYGYVGNNPTNLTDPDGLRRCGSQGTTTTSKVPRVRRPIFVKGTIGRGGPHRETKKYSLLRVVESNHAPAANSYRGTPYGAISREDMPAVSMRRLQHIKTATWGSSQAAKDYRESQRALMKVGKFAQAQKMDITNMLRLTPKNDRQEMKQGLIGMVQYTNSFLWKGRPLINNREAAALTRYITKY